MSDKTEDDDREPDPDEDDDEDWDEDEDEEDRELFEDDTVDFDRLESDLREQYPAYRAHVERTEAKKAMWQVIGIAVLVICVLLFLRSLMRPSSPSSYPDDYDVGPFQTAPIDDR